MPVPLKRAAAEVTAQLDQLAAGLRSRDPQAIEDAREWLHHMADHAGPGQLYMMLAGPLAVSELIATKGNL